MNKTYLFISDIHLGLQSKETETKKERLLVKFLEFAEDNCNELFIVGDLFDYWFEYKRVYQKGYFRTLTALQNLTESGIKVHYFIGNHDFFHKDFFENEIGVQLYPEAKEFVLNDKKFFIGHGDGLVKNDLGYNILKKILRNRFIQWMYGLIHPDLGIAIASRTSKSSRDYTAKKDYGEEDGLFEAAKNFIDQGNDYVLFGHLHKRCFYNYKQGTYINLGSWIDNPCYGKFTDKFEITDWK
ncbi:MAG: UDP-2,3-diacylglucosamine diphosphatase [Ignavibacteriota bacterium]|nr:UDP-2,3-diacylglucosamine diphosphatase [Ignavibacteriota bacterium]MBW7843181.1 UDP-2,3-diacylglucosamine diphosphatase [Ignavibacterium sp.]MCO6446968.1 UDP-2,3-diacylglucosamine diphosphatase [Ignavibacterium album]MCZ2267580.1 UDP-2,3-diacylglucosamine diphosphatase [Ignavibacteriales bacterium]MDX9711831.1 UDP-2,3-diacylglucosamine diphosphatase [Ignavibacteriaceae bacterium]